MNNFGLGAQKVVERKYFGQQDDLASGCIFKAELFVFSITTDVSLIESISFWIKN